MWTNTQFWKDATWRCFRTFCQTLAAMLAGQTANLLSAPWIGMLSTAAGAALVSLLMSIDRERVVTTSEITEPSVPAGLATQRAERLTQQAQQLKTYVDSLERDSNRRLARHRLAPEAQPTFQPPGLGCGDALR